MTEHDFHRGRQAAVLPKLLVSRAHGRKFAASGESSRPPCRSVVGAGRLQIRHQPGPVGIGHGVPLHVEHRRGETVAHQRIAEIVHVDEGVHMTAVVDARPGTAQLTQRIGPQARERKQSARREYTPKLAERRVGIAPRQHEIAQDQLNASVGQRQRGGIGADAVEAAPPAAPPCSDAQHAEGRIECDHAGGRIAALQKARRTRGVSSANGAVPLTPPRRRPATVPRRSRGARKGFGRGLRLDCRW